MSLEINDTGMLQALEVALQHAPPFSEDECGTIRRLHVQGSADLSPLVYCPQLRSLTIEGARTTDWQVLSTLTQLLHLNIGAATISNLKCLSRCLNLHHLQLNGCQVADLSPLLELPNLKSMVCNGNPLTETSWKSGRLRLEKNGVAVSLSSWNDWLLTRQLWQQGVPLGVLTLDGTRRAMVAPNQPQFTKGNCDFVRSDEFAVEVLLFELPLLGSAEAAQTALFSFLDEKLSDPSRHFDLFSQREIGQLSAVRTWIDQSQLTTTQKASLMTFVEHFPDVTCYRESEELVNALQSQIDGQMPHDFIAVRQVLAGLAPNHKVRIVFDTEVREEIGENYHYYLGELGGNEYDVDKFDREEDTIIPCAIGIAERHQSVLAFNSTNKDDPRIYIYSPASLRDPFYADRSLSDVLRPLFNSYTELFEHIEKIEIPAENGVQLYNKK